MTSVININKTIEFIPNPKDNSETYWLSLFKEKYNSTCNKKYGYILDILKINKVLNSTISIYNGNCILTCEIQIVNLLPIIHNSIEGIIQKIYKEGIFLLCENCMKIFIPTENLKDNHYSGNLKDFKPKINEQIIVKIIDIRFSKGKYDCIGKIC